MGWKDADQLPIDYHKLFFPTRKALRWNRLKMKLFKQTEKLLVLTPGIESVTFYLRGSSGRKTQKMLRKIPFTNFRKLLSFKSRTKYLLYQCTMVTYILVEVSIVHLTNAVSRSTKDDSSETLLRTLASSPNAIKYSGERGNL